MAELAVAIVADDLTGAMDAAAPFARRGARTGVVIAPEHLAEVIGRDDLPEVLAINTESRHLSASEAAARVAEACGALLPLAPRVLFKKIDSTLRGNVVAECLAARRSSQRGLLISPAVPAQGRTLHDGQVFVHGAPLAATDYGRDARSVPPVEPLPTLFARQGLVIPVIPAGEMPNETDVIVDALNEADLRVLARRMLATPGRWLVVGAAGLSEALAVESCPSPSGPVPPAPPLDNVLIAVGSRCDQARRQVACLCEAVPSLPIIHAMEKSGAAQPAAARQKLVLPGSQSSPGYTSEQVAQGMARCVEGLLDTQPGQAPLLFLTGGDTAMAVLARLGVRQVELAGEWASGVAWGWLDGDRQRPIMTKAGGFGDDALLMRLGQASTTRG
ncbi:four-carbon acid sugar kinase family protein [Halomonas sp. HP20-15]|uniref:four-carbon acid sugar kinase family protein n=1 Tax=Halomonas sp. HP20-15 TaxID=3085901 RepID=UPI002981F2FD|nr:four-carbon acid sugar kinase family protein [Halomonas sp. HP20-15]MDW5378101.1 four-carbon acid sugar kinase family protein [Halomonas sp. HP20-15]